MIRRPSFAILLCLGMVLCPHAAAETPLEQCRQEALGMDGMQTCEQEELERQQQRLDQTVSRLAQELDATRRRQLAGVQEAWMQWRSTNCRFHRDPEAGSLQPLQELQCQSSMTATRVQELEKLFNQR